MVDISLGMMWSDL